MTLVAIGLVWIDLRLAWNKSNAWLMKVNLLTAMAILYPFCFVDVGGAIARFNVDHSRAGTARGFALDIDYLEEIGPPALPALEIYLKTAKDSWREEEIEDVHLFMAAGRLRTRLTWDLATRHRDWRGYTFRSYRLALDVAKPRTGLYGKPPPDGGWRVE